MKKRILTVLIALLMTLVPSCREADNDSEIINEAKLATHIYSKTFTPSMS